MKNFDQVFSRIWPTPQAAKRGTTRRQLLTNVSIDCPIFPIIVPRLPWYQCFKIGNYDNQSDAVGRQKILTKSFSRIGFFPPSLIVTSKVTWQHGKILAKSFLGSGQNSKRRSVELRIGYHNNQSDAVGRQKFWPSFFSDLAKPPSGKTRNYEAQILKIGYHDNQSDAVGRQKILTKSFFRIGVFPPSWIVTSKVTW